MTQVSDIMTRGVRTMAPQETIAQAARAMQELGVGAIPICEGDRLIGMVTDRDIVLRAVAKSLSPEQTFLEEVLSPDVCWCFDDDPVEVATKKMQDARIRRIPVLDHDQHLVGVLSLGDVSVKGDSEEAGDALSDISEPAQPHDRLGKPH